MLTFQLVATVTYGAIERTAQYMADRSEAPRPKVYTVELTFPMTHAEIVAAFHAKIKEIKKDHPKTAFDILPTDTKLEGKGNRMVAIIDSISSNPGMYQPWKEMVKVCKEEGVWSLIDAAHSIGQEVSFTRTCRLYMLTLFLPIVEHQPWSHAARLLGVQLPQMAVC